MKLHRFYTPNLELKHDFWIHDEKLLHQWNRVLRFQPGQEMVLFDGVRSDRLYKIAEINRHETHLIHVTDFERQVPKYNIYLLWSLLKKDKNEWVLQKCTELGVSHFLPLLAGRSEKTGFNIERAKKIITEAAEQCGRSDIPTIREPVNMSTAVSELNEKVQLIVAEQSKEQRAVDSEVATIEPDPLLSVQNSMPENPLGVLIGPEGGWSDDEKMLFESQKLQHLNLHDFTLRAETAAIAAVTKLLQ